MEKELFNYISANQRKWAQEFAEQKKMQRIQKNKINLESNWYGRTKEYGKLWRKQGAQGFNK
jgi:hypothetical protein